MAGGNYGPPPKKPQARGANGRSAFLENEKALREMDVRNYEKAKKQYLKNGVASTAEDWRKLSSYKPETAAYLRRTKGLVTNR
jgi:hypothetical protein